MNYPRQLLDAQRKTCWRDTLFQLYLGKSCFLLLLSLIKTPCLVVFLVFVEAWQIIWKIIYDPLLFCGILIMACYNPHITIWLGRISTHIYRKSPGGAQLVTAQDYRIIILHNIQTSLVATKTLRICMKLYHVFGLYRWYNLFTSMRITTWGEFGVCVW